MSTITVQQFLDAAFLKLNEMISPAQLRNPSPRNRQVLMGVCAELNVPNVTITPENIPVLAANLRKACVTLCNDPGRWHLLAWSVEPRSIQRYKPEQAENNVKIAEGQQEAINAEEKRTARAEHQKRYLQQSLSAIEAFYPTSHRGVEHRIMAETKALLRGYLEKQVAKSDVDQKDVFDAITKFIEKAYLDVERSGERSTSRLD